LETYRHVISNGAKSIRNGLACCWETMLY